MYPNKLIFYYNLEQWVACLFINGFVCISNLLSLLNIQRDNKLNKINNKITWIINVCYQKITNKPEITLLPKSSYKKIKGNVINTLLLIP